MRSVDVFHEFNLKAELGKFVINKFNESGMTKAQFAKSVLCPQILITNLLNGDIKQVSIGSLYGVVVVLDYEVRFLVKPPERRF